MLGCMLCILGGYGIVGVVASNATDRPSMTVFEFEALLFQPAFMVFLALSFGESIDLMWSSRRTVMTYVMVCSLREFCPLFSAFASMFSAFASTCMQYVRTVRYVHAVCPYCALSCAFHWVCLCMCECSCMRACTGTGMHSWLWDKRLPTLSTACVCSALYACDCMYC